MWGYWFEGGRVLKRLFGWGMESWMKCWGGGIGGMGRVDGKGLNWRGWLGDMYVVCEGKV